MADRPQELTTHTSGVRIKCRRDDFSDGGVQCLLTQTSEDGDSRKSLVVDKIILRPREDRYYATPTFQLDFGAAQALMDSLWECGLRPTEGKGSAGQLTAVQNHLTDMQKIAFDLLGRHRPY